MQAFTLAVLAAASASAQFSTLKITEDSKVATKYYRTDDSKEVGSVGFVIPVDNFVSLKNDDLAGTSTFYMPNMVGGAIEYDLNLSSVGCGCVAGLYAVNVSNQCNSELNIEIDSPQCASIDLMQANVAGFQTQMHPCANGTCDAVSQCSYTMAKEGEAKYGAGAYGRNGSLINTKDTFRVRTEFVSKNSYKNLWKVRTRLTQGENEMLVEADCTDYIDSMTSKLDGSMALTASTWKSSGRDAQLANFEDSEQCES
mmetsp:Transcript_11879/g.15125  ORF Transcript_11879/g.15125 Transcript_11879/m.15125 type:complete len:256 (-) Transcript_11879:1506-2273(-)